MSNNKLMFIIFTIVVLIFIMIRLITADSYFTDRYTKCMMLVKNINDCDKPEVIRP